MSDATRELAAAANSLVGSFLGDRSKDRGNPPPRGEALFTKLLLSCYWVVTWRVDNKRRTTWCPHTPPFPFSTHFPIRAPGFLLFISPQLIKTLWTPSIIGYTTCANTIGVMACTFICCAS